MIGKIVDVETYSPIDLKIYGAAPYVAHKEFEVLIKVEKSIDLTFINKPFIIAHNASFEARVLREDVFYICTSHLSRLLGGPSSLQDCATYWELGEFKMGEGKALIKYFKTIKNNKEDSEYKENLRLLKEYCKQDVNLTGKLFFKLLSVIKNYMSKEAFLKELEYFNLTLDCDLKGCAIDQIKLNDYIKKKEALLKEANDQFFYKYKLNPRSPKQLLAYANKIGPRLESTNKIDLMYKWATLSPEQQQLFNATFELKSPILKKLDTIKARLVEGKLNPSLVHFGTESGRYTSYGANILNFPRTEKVEKIKTLDDIKKTMRTLIVPKNPFDKIIGIDYKQIELRTALYSLKYMDILEKLYKGWDIYVEFAKQIFKKDDINKNERFMGKVWVLSIGYGAYPKRLAITAGAPKHLEAASIAKDIYVTEWFPNIVNWWEKVYQEVVNAYKLKKPFILKLPNGAVRLLSPTKLLFNVSGHTKSSSSVGGQIFSIYNQSLVREIINEKKLKLKEYGILWDVHDEIVFDEKKEFVPEIQKIMEEPIEWMPNFKLQTDVEIGKTWS